jgi:hypothetical protein
VQEHNLRIQPCNVALQPKIKRRKTKDNWTRYLYLFPPPYTQTSTYTLHVEVQTKIGWWKHTLMWYASFACAWKVSSTLHTLLGIPTDRRQAECATTLYIDRLFCDAISAAKNEEPVGGSKEV